MKLRSIVIENLKSFRDKTEIEFNDDCNILIGPNAGGKSNLLDILTITLRHFFLKTFSIYTEGSEQTGISFNIQTHPGLFSPIEYYLEKFTNNENNISSIEMTFEVTQKDIENMNEIKSKKEVYKKNLTKYKNSINFINTIDSVCQTLENSNLKEGMELKYNIPSIPNTQNFIYLDPYTLNDNEKKAYLFYLNNIELFMLLSEGESNLKPIYLFFSPYRAMNVNNLRVNLSAQNFYELYQNYTMTTSKSTSSVIELASYYFSNKKRNLEANASNIGYQERWKNDEEVKMINRYLKKLGYDDLDVKLVDPNKNIYEFVFKNNGRIFSISQASSGEKEIMNFLLSIFAFNIKEGLIVIDEPELHLHPRWQRILIELFMELSQTTNNQFIITTHSPVFIDENTVSNIIRIYRDDTGTSKAIKIKESNLPEVKNLLHMINSHNNEKLFFADKIVLVEGITDRLIFEALINYYKQKYKQNDDSRIIEVLEVHGKNNFDMYKRILEEIGCTYYIVADLDYVNELARGDGNKEIMELFITDYKSIDDNVIKNKKSLDRKKLSELIEEAVNKNEITHGLRNVWVYIKQRHLKLKENLTEEEKNKLIEYIQQKEERNIFVLYGGNQFECTEIEDFLPKDYKGLDGIIEFTKQNELEKWINDDMSGKERLKEIVYKILGIH